MRVFEVRASHLGTKEVGLVRLVVMQISIYLAEVSWRVALWRWWARRSWWRCGGHESVDWRMDAWRNVRTVELPALGEVKEGELGLLVVGDWLMLISPVMKDLTVSSGAWWDQVLAVAAEAYAQWLQADPLQRLHIRPRAVEDDGGRWSRVAQRAQAMLVAALPPGLKAEVLAERAATAWEILFRVFEGWRRDHNSSERVPTTLSEVVDGVRTWKRWLARTRELKVAIPDATLLVGALDRFVGMVTKHSGQAMFRLNAARAGLRVDVAPSLEAVAQLADVVLAEGEAALHGASTSSTTTAKVKALVTKDGGGWEKGKDSPKGGGKGKGKDASAAPVCRFFLTDGGCKKGAGTSVDAVGIAEGLRIPARTAR